MGLDEYTGWYIRYYTIEYDCEVQFMASYETALSALKGGVSEMRKLPIPGLPLVPRDKSDWNQGLMADYTNSRGLERFVNAARITLDTVGRDRSRATAGEVAPPDGQPNPAPARD